MQETSSHVREKDRGNVSFFVKPLILTIVLASSLAIIHLSPLGHYLAPSNIHVLKDRLAGFHALAPIIFLAAGAVIVAMGAPRSIISILGGMVFGFLGGTLLSLAAALLGSIAIFWLTRALGRPLFCQRAGQRLKALEGHIEQNGFLVVILLRQLPLTCMLVNVLIGLTSVNTIIFILGSVVGLLPEAAIFSLFGSSVRGSFVLRVSMASFFLILFVLFLRIYYRSSPFAKELSQKLIRDKAD